MKKRRKPKKNPDRENLYKKCLRIFKDLPEYEKGLLLKKFNYPSNILKGNRASSKIRNIVHKISSWVYERKYRKNRKINPVFKQYAHEKWVLSKRIKTDKYLLFPNATAVDRYLTHVVLKNDSRLQLREKLFQETLYLLETLDQGSLNILLQHYQLQQDEKGYRIIIEKVADWIYRQKFDNGKAWRDNVDTRDSWFNPSPARLKTQNAAFRQFPTLDAIVDHVEYLRPRLEQQQQATNNHSLSWYALTTQLHPNIRDLIVSRFTNISFNRVDEQEQIHIMWVVADWLYRNKLTYDRTLTGPGFRYRRGGHRKYPNAQGYLKYYETVIYKKLVKEEKEDRETTELYQETIQILNNLNNQQKALLCEMFKLKQLNLEVLLVFQNAQNIIGKIAQWIKDYISHAFEKPDDKVTNRAKLSHTDKTSLRAQNSRRYYFPKREGIETFLGFWQQRKELAQEKQRIHQQYWQMIVRKLNQDQSRVIWNYFHIVSNDFNPEDISPEKTELIMCVIANWAYRQKNEHPQYINPSRVRIRWKAFGSRPYPTEEAVDAFIAKIPTLRKRKSYDNRPENPVVKKRKTSHEPQQQEEPSEPDVLDSIPPLQFI